MDGLVRRSDAGAGEEGVGVMCDGSGAGARSGIWGGVGVGGGGVLVAGELVEGAWASAAAPVTSDSAQTTAPFFNPTIVCPEPSSVGPYPR
jgi:hypothetical protein